MIEEDRVEIMWCLGKSQIARLWCCQSKSPIIYAEIRDKRGYITVLKAAETITWDQHECSIEDLSDRVEMFSKDTSWTVVLDGVTKDHAWVTNSIRYRDNCVIVTSGQAPLPSCLDGALKICNSAFKMRLFLRPLA